MSSIHLNIRLLYILFSFEYHRLMKNEVFEKYFSRRGALRRASLESGIPYITLVQHANNVRRVSPAMAVRYEELLGIPRWELRPDLWCGPEEDGGERSGL